MNLRYYPFIPEQNDSRSGVVFLQPCVVTKSVIGDLIDNDCDGKIDEEKCYGKWKGIGNVQQKVLRRIERYV